MKIGLHHCVFSRQDDRKVYIEYQIWSLHKKITVLKDFTMPKAVGFDSVITGLGWFLDHTNRIDMVFLIQIAFGLSFDVICKGLC